MEECLRWDATALNHPEPEPSAKHPSAGAHTADLRRTLPGSRPPPALAKLGEAKRRAWTLASTAPPLPGDGEAWANADVAVSHTAISTVAASQYAAAPGLSGWVPTATPFLCLHYVLPSFWLRPTGRCLPLPSRNHAGSALAWRSINGYIRSQ
jgi:hypothetical protein